MCFSLKGSKTRKPKSKIAAKDIIVYKAIRKDRWGWVFNLKIKGKEVKWKKGWWYYETTPFLDMEYDGKGEWDFNGHCFHSVINKEDCQQNYVDPEDEFLQKFIIPKDAKYYKNQRQYISDQLIYPEQ